ncbi:hypothetical protein CALVIDRAFT_603198 [Calocera viscosa TUFC12733]|uniref:Sds3-like-domain-containing protein n=1 Tax=Calocera viscosa (strain TUFC12733) TaxID=1330018 RepID=A0A167G243_CALVF|nr:hypothetical protein CALVIDRAFT_603198 [Calocera viscosa TUFC12733]
MQGCVRLPRVEANRRATCNPPCPRSPHSPQPATMSADPPAMSPTNSSALSDLSRSASPVIDKPQSPFVPQSPTKPPSSTQNQRANAPAAQSPPPVARRESHDSDVSAHSDRSSSLTNLSDEQPEAEADEDGDNENEDENDGDSDAKDAPTPEPVIKTPKRSFVPDGMWAWASKKSKSNSKSKSKDASEDESYEEGLESEDSIESYGSDLHDAKGEVRPEVSIQSTVDRKPRARTNSVVSRAPTNSVAKELINPKTDEGSGSNDTPVKSPSLSDISDVESVKEDEAKHDEDVDVQMDEDHGPAEQEVAAPVVVVEAFDRMEGMETLTALEVALAMTRDYLYNTKMQHYAMEEEALNAGTHPELLHQYDELQRRKEARLAIAEKKYQAVVARTRRKRQEEASLVMNTWRYERDELQRTMTDSYISEKRALEREKANLERYSSPRPVTPPMPTEFAEEPPKKRVKVEKLIRSVTAKNVRKNIESALSHPSVDGVSADDLDADLIAMGVRGKPVEAGLGLQPPLQNGHRELLPVMPQPPGDYHQGVPPPMHQSQFAHQAPLHIHHIHPPFTHSHQAHTSHLPPQSQQVISHHGPPSFSSWPPEPQPAFPPHQHHHHNHLQHNHPPPHMQPMPGLPQHLQQQGPSQPPRYTYAVPGTSPWSGVIPKSIAFISDGSATATSGTAKISRTPAIEEHVLKAKG